MIKKKVRDMTRKRKGEEREQKTKRTWKQNEKQEVHHRGSSSRANQCLAQELCMLKQNIDLSTLV